MKKLLLLSFVLLAFTACEELLNEIEESLSSFEATVTGNVSSSFNGNPFFLNAIVESQMPQGSTLTVEMENANDPDEAMFLSIALAGVTTGVAAGTYEFAANNPDVVVSGNYSTLSDSYYIPDPTATNQIILSKVEDTRIEGTFNLTLSNVLGDKVTATGSFTAIGTTTTL